MQQVRRLVVEGLQEHGRVALLGHELPDVRRLPPRDREPQHAPELRTAAGLATCAPDRAPSGVVQAPTAAVEPAEQGQFAEAERGCEQALSQDDTPNVMHFRDYLKIAVAAASLATCRR